MTLTIEVFKQDASFIAKCRELDIYSYGSTSDDAVERLKKVITFYVKSVGDYIDEETNEVKDYFNVENHDLN